jgi:hypothetical protein
MAPVALKLIDAPDSPLEANPAEAPQGTLLHKFVKADSWRGGLTKDAKGENLPKSGSPWIYEKEVLVTPGVRRVGATATEILRAIDERGFIVLPVADDA